MDIESSSARKPSFYRRQSDRIMRLQMIYAAAGAAFVNVVSYYVIIHTPLIETLFPLQKLDPYAKQDNIVLVISIAMASIIFLLLMYTFKVRGLLKDIQNLTQERDRERELKNRNQKLEALGLLAAGVSHEINTSLQTILGSCEMAQNRRLEPEQAAMFLQRAIDNSLHARRVINNVLVFSSSSGSKSTQVESLSEIVDEAINYSQAYLSQQVVFEVIHTTGHEVFVDIDRTCLHQAVSNLANNAAHAMQHRGTIHISTGIHDINAESTPEFSAIPAGKFTYLKIRDTGKGISPEHLIRIFDPFFTTKPIGEGTGLGLSMVHGLIKSMNGHITVNSTVGVGTEFTILLPVASKSKTHEKS